MTQKPLILAVETSAPIGSVAIAVGERLLAEAAFSGPMRHSSEIFPAVGGLLQRFARKPKDIEHIYISIGPGSFTGLRIAVALAKTMHLANAVRVVAVNTLDVIAANVINLTSTSDEQRLSAVASTLRSKATAEDGSAKAEASSIEYIATILDAKRDQFYIAVYQHCTSNERRLSAVASTLRSKATAEDGSAKAEATCASGTSDEPRATSDVIWKKILPDSLLTASQFLEKFAAPDQPLWLLGVGLVYYKDDFRANGIRFLDEQYWYPKASKVHLLGWKKAQAEEFADPLTLRPNYLRTPDVKLKED